MAEQFIGRVEILDTDSNVRLTLDGDKGTGTLQVRNSDGEKTIRLDGDGGNCLLGGNGTPGGLVVDNEAGVHLISLLGRGTGTLDVRTSDGVQTIRLDGDGGDLVVRNEAGVDVVGLHNQGTGTLRVRNSTGQETIRLDGDGGDLVVRNEAGVSIIGLHGGRPTGSLVVRNSDGEVTVQLDGAGGDCTLGGNGVPGDLVVKNGAGADAIALQGSGILRMHNADGEQTIILDGTGDMVMRNSDGETTIHLDGNSGDIILSNADCAEDFGISSTEKVEPGTVMVIDQEDKLRQCTEAYDKRVAGVISGAGSYRPGIVLNKKHSQNNRLPVALLGKVYCKADAQYSAIEVGDLLTTSLTPGHAMKAADPLRAFGAVIGKALRPLTGGQALVPILIALQ